MSTPIYQPLKTNRSTRLVKIHTGTDGSNLNLELVEVDLDTKPDYDAISYIWGRETTVASILINDHPVSIRQNLLNFLLQPKRHKHSTFLWVDAISIRQDDPVEKAQQVAMIGDIFRTARTVLAWVGEHTNQSEILFYTATRTRKKAKPSLDEQLKLFAIWGPFLSRLYWKRLWIIQELALAAKIVIHCGDSFARWKDVFRLRHRGLIGPHWHGIYVRQMDLQLAIHNPPSALLEAFRAFVDQATALTELDAIIHRSKVRRTKSLRGCLKRTCQIGDLNYHFHAFQCANRRDCVYALLSLD